MRRLGLVLASLTCGLSALGSLAALAQENVGVTRLDVAPKFPQNGYRPLPPHFQPRQTITAAPEVSIAPPILPVYEQPTIPGDGYLWVPGYWAWRKSVPDFFWVPGTWVHPPQTGLVWTPPYWSSVNGGYAFHAGYWAAQVGFYGGIAYGFGYNGNGYKGGRWEDGEFSYNRAYNNLGSVAVSRAYGQASASKERSSRVSYNGEPGGTTARPSRRQQELIDTRRFKATAEQRRHLKLAAMDRSLYSKLNNSEPAVAATQHAGVLTGREITSSRRSQQTAGSKKW